MPPAVPARYLIEELVGQGGAGEVYRATDTLLRRVVALKVIRSDKQTPDADARLLREARAAAALRHPNVVVIYDVGEASGATYLAMEYLQGASLRRHVGRGDRATRVRWLVEVARALDAAHRAGLVHRDIKPENIFICEDGSAKVLDFGIAKRFGPEAVPDGATEAAPSFETRSGALAGTPLYMAPEQRATGLATPLTDQYAWGLVACELLTGANPRLAPEEVERGLDALPGDLGRTVRRALSADPNARFVGMSAVLRALSDPEAVEPAVSPPPTTEGPLPAPTETRDSATTTEVPVPTAMPAHDTLLSAGASTARRSRRGSILAACGLVAIGAASFTAWRSRDIMPPRAKPAPAACTYALLSDFALDAPLDDANAGTLIAGAGGATGVAIGAAWLDTSGQWGAIRVLADRDAVTAQRVTSPLSSLLGVGVAWLAGTPHLLATRSAAADVEARLILDQAFGNDAPERLLHAGGGRYCRPGPCAYRPQTVRATFGAFDPEVPGAPTLVAAAQTVEAGGGQAIRSFAPAFKGEPYFTAPVGHALASLVVAGDGSSAAVAFVTGERAHVGHLGDGRTPRAFGAHVKRVALAFGDGVAHMIYVGDGQLHHVRWPKDGEPEERAAPTDLRTPDALDLAVAGDVLTVGWREGGRVGVATGRTLDRAVRVSESQPRDGPWVSSSAREALVAWLEAAPPRVRRAVARCPD